MPMTIGMLASAHKGKFYQYTDYQAITTNLTTYNFTANIGAAAAGRVVVVTVFGSRATSTPSSISSVTINGVTATVQASVTNDAYISAHYSAVVPTGSTGVTVSVVFGQGQNRAAIGVYALYGFASATATDTSTDNNSPFQAAAFDVAADGVAIASAWTNNSTATFTWTGLDEDFDDIIEAANAFSGASKFFATTQTGLTSQATPTTINQAGAVWTAYA